MPTFYMKLAKEIISDGCGSWSLKINDRLKDHTDILY